MEYIISCIHTNRGKKTALLTTNYTPLFNYACKLKTLVIAEKKLLINSICQLSGPAGL